MRTIKFRAYYKEHKTIYPVTTLYDDGVVKILINDFNRAVVHCSECELMQFTGLLDKHGKEIYEGDIVSIMDCEPSLYRICYWEQRFTWGVEYIGSDKTNWQHNNLEDYCEGNDDFHCNPNMPIKLHYKTRNKLLWFYVRIYAKTIRIWNTITASKMAHFKQEAKQQLDYFVHLRAPFIKPMLIESK